MIDPDASLAAAADHNLATTWTTSARLAGGAVDRVDDVRFFNGAIATGPSTNPEETISAIVDFMAGRSVPWVLWARPGVADELLEAGRAAGLEETSGPPAMGLSPISDIPAPPPQLRIELVNDSHELDAHRRLLCRAFGTPEELVSRLMPDAVVDDEALAVLLGTVEGEPVSTALVSLSEDTAGVYNVATPVEHQRRGYGAALTWAAICEGVHRGATRSILQTSAAGQPVYERMGYAHLGTYAHLQGSPG